MYMSDVDRVNMHLFYLESQFPRLAFHFFKSQECHPDTIMIRVIPRDGKGSYQEAARKGQWHEEEVDPMTFPTPDFLARCALIA